MNRAWLLMFSLAPSVALAQEKCDCTVYPFTPNPPCYSECVAKLSAKYTFAESDVRNLDPGVFVAISVLAENKQKTVIDFAAIQDKATLEQAASQAIQASTKLERARD